MAARPRRQRARISAARPSNSTTSEADTTAPSVLAVGAERGARERNFYFNTACRYGYTDAALRIQELYLAGRKDEAAAAVPEDLVRATSLIGPESYVAERIAAFAAAGVTTLNLQPLDESRENRLRTVETMRRLCDAH